MNSNDDSAANPSTGSSDLANTNTEPKTVVKTDISEDIDPANEVQGTRLILIHIAICLCTFLVGLVCVSYSVPKSQEHYWHGRN
jgi:ABC-type Fe3+ transport system permease subunit